MKPSVALLGAGMLLTAGWVSAQPRRPGPWPRPPVAPTSAPSETPAEPPEATGDLRARFGAEIAGRLMRSDDPEERLQGIARAASARSPDALALLTRGTEPSGIPRGDPRATIELARALSEFVDDPAARRALADIVRQPAPSQQARGPLGEVVLDDVDLSGRIELARETAALALTTSRDVRAAEQLAVIAREGGPGQTAALRALEAAPPMLLAPLGTSSLVTPAMLHLAAKVGDLRALDAMRAMAHSTEASLKAAALVALGEAGDARALPLARVALEDAHPAVRSAAAEALVLLGAPEGAKAVETLLGDDATASAGARLAERVQSEGVVKALAARAAASTNAGLRADVLAALGHAAAPDAVGALVTLLRDPALEADAASALARSPSASAMGALEALAASPGTRRLAARAYLVRAIIRRERSPRMEGVLSELAGSRDGRDRAVGVGAQVALGERGLRDALGDPDPGVRRAVAMASLARPSKAQRAALLRALAGERDAGTREILALGLVEGDRDGLVPTSSLQDRIDTGRSDAPLAALALSARGGDDERAKIDALLASRDPLLRAHAALGLGASSARDAAGRLARVYAYEADAAVRRAVVLALARRTGEDAAAPARVGTLTLASRLDPDASVRGYASRALARLPARGRALEREVAWLRVVPGDARARGQGAVVTGALATSDGLALPVAFDDDGYAVVPGIAPGAARVVLAPRLPTYDASAP